MEEVPGGCEGLRGGHQTGQEESQRQEEPRECQEKHAVNTERGRRVQGWAKETVLGCLNMR